MRNYTRTGLFFPLHATKLLAIKNLSREKLKIAKAESGKDIKKFVATRLYQHPSIPKDLVANLSKIEAAA